MVDNTDGTEWNDVAIQLIGSVSGAGPEVSLTGAEYNDRIPDWVFFVLTGAAAGETISVVGYAGAGGHDELGAVAFDTVSSVPEPASLGVLFTGVAALVAGRRRRG